MQSSHRNNFDFLRLAAALLVWFEHCVGFTHHPDLVAETLRFDSYGSLGVTIFFIISGYFIAMSYENNNSFLRFTKNRLLRIMPALIVVVLLSVFVLGPIMTTLSLPDYFTDSRTWRYLRTLLVFPLQYNLPGVLRGNPVDGAVNGSLWTLQHEVRLYAAIAIMGVLGILRPRLMFVILLALWAILLYGIITMPGNREHVLTREWGNLELLVKLASEFALGSFIYLARLPLKFSYMLFLAAGAAGIIIFVHFIGLHHIDTNILCKLVFDIAFAYGIIWFGFLKLPLLPSISAWGDFSYGFYVYAFPMQQITYRLVGNDFHAFVFTSLVATFLCAVLSWHLVEKPALAKK